MATSWHWDHPDERIEVWIIQRTKEHRRNDDDRIVLTKAQILKLAKDIQEKDEGRL